LFVLLGHFEYGFGTFQVDIVLNQNNEKNYMQATTWGKAFDCGDRGERAPCTHAAYAGPERQASNATKTKTAAKHQ
jgi:hypothetical protein